jgi:mycothiol system anti-sigma-R factor
MLCGSVALSGISCEEVLKEIEQYLDGELDSDRGSNLATHLGTCSPCLDRAEFQRKLKEIVRSKCRSETPEHVIVRIREAVRIEYASGRDAAT